MRGFFLAMTVWLWSQPVWGWTLMFSGVVGWSTQSLNVYVNPAQCTLSEAEILALVDRSLSVWNGIATSALTVARASENSGVTAAEYLAGDSHQVPLIVCDTNFSKNVGSEDVVPAATFVSSSGSHFTSAAIFLNSQEGTGAEISTLNEAELRVVVAHEMGHVLGLGHTGVQNSLMYYSISNKDDARLGEDDIMGLSYLYPRNELTGGSFGCAATHRSERPKFGLLFSLFFVFGLILLGRRWYSAE